MSCAKQMFLIKIHYNDIYNYIMSCLFGKYLDFPPRNYNATICEIISTVQASSNCLDSKLLKLCPLD